MITRPFSQAVLDRALVRDKAAVAALVGLFEDPRPDAVTERVRVTERLSALRARGVRVGLTGAPGAGKSTLLGALVPALLADPARSVAILAVDPSSPLSGGALLGDRTRVRLPLDERRAFFRSQATDGRLGGLSPHTFSACRVLELLFDVVFVETVGVGQSETEVAHLADDVWLVLSPGAGDGLQALKAGVMEVADRFVLGKSDLGALADETHRALRSALRLVRPHAPPPVHRVSAHTGSGLSELASALDSVRPDAQRRAASDAYFLRAWLLDREGRDGLDRLAVLGGAAKLLSDAETYEAAQASLVPHGE